MNRLLNEFIQGLEARYPSDSTAMPMSEWITTHTHLRGKKFSFKDHGFQKQITDDLHTDLSVIKISQVGATEVQLRKFLAFLRRNTGVSGIFSLPSQPMRDRLSQTRVKSLVESEEIFNPLALSKPVRQKSIYQIDQSFGYFTGATEGEATSIPADILFIDEIDLADQGMLGLFQSRLQASKWKITQRFSTPTYVGYGIDAHYQASDQHEYMCKCGSCGHWQVPLWTPRFMHLPGFRAEAETSEQMAQLAADEIEAIDLDNAYVRCEKCSRPLDLASNREWVAVHPTRRTRGYRIRPFSTTNITIPYIFEQLNRYRIAENLRGFFNTVLGEPFNDGNARLSEDDIRACMISPAVPSELPEGPMLIGGDVGQVCHIVIGTANHIVEMVQVPQSELRDFILGRLATYPIIAGCLDMYPYTPLVEEIRDASGKVIMPMAYATTPNVAPLRENKDEFDETTHFIAHRTKAIDAVAKDIRTRQYRLSGYGGHGSLLVNHLRDMIRIETPDEPPVWNKLSGQDHFFHAMVFHRLAVRMKLGIDFKSDKDLRTHIFLLGGGGLQDKSPALHNVSRTRKAGILSA